MNYKKINNEFMQENSMELDDKRDYSVVNYRPLTLDEFMEIAMKIINDTDFKSEESPQNNSTTTQLPITHQNEIAAEIITAPEKKPKKPRKENGLVQKGSNAARKVRSFFAIFRDFSFDSVKTSLKLSEEITIPRMIIVFLLQIALFGFIFASISHTFYNYILRTFDSVFNSIPYAILDSFHLLDDAKQKLDTTIFSPLTMFLVGAAISILILLCSLLLNTLFAKIFRINISILNCLKSIASSNIAVVIVNLVACLFISVLDTRFYNPYLISVLIVIMIFAHMYAISLRTKAFNLYTDHEARPIKAVSLTTATMMTLPILGAMLGIKFGVLSLVESLQNGVSGISNNIFDFFSNINPFG